MIQKLVVHFYMIQLQMLDIELEPYGHVNASDKIKGLQEAMTGDEQSTAGRNKGEGGYKRVDEVKKKYQSSSTVSLWLAN